MQKEDTKYDVAVIGGGPAGIMASIQASRNGLRVVLIEKNKQLGKKLLLTGGGRCNLTNAQFNLRELVKNYNNGEFLFHAFSVFGPKETIEFFNKIGIKTKTEKSGRVFPVSEDAGDILDALKKELEKFGVEILYNSEILDIKKAGKSISKIILKNNKEIVAKKYILATGGKSYTQTGSDGFGYKLAEKLGHTIVKPCPALSPIRLSDECARSLQGISLKDIKISVLHNEKKQLSENGELLFTHYGISGPAVLNISARVGELLKKGEVKINLDLSPLLNQEQLLKEFEEYLKGYPNKTIKNILSEFTRQKLAEVLLSITGIAEGKIANNLSKIEKNAVVKIIKNFEITVEDVMGFEQAMVTRGGVLLKEIDHKTMQSKIIDNLFFAGEIIDADGKTGGFNLQMCWSTGYLAGQNK